MSFQVKKHLKSTAPPIVWDEKNLHVFLLFSTKILKRFKIFKISVVFHKRFKIFKISVVFHKNFKKILNPVNIIPKKYSEKQKLEKFRKFIFFLLFFEKLYVFSG
jgi:hypothetical protein